METHIPNIPLDSGINMNLPLREDIGAELDDFLLLNVLGIQGEAQSSVQTILWRHLRYFPVFAEVAEYVIIRGDRYLQWKLLEVIHRGDIEATCSDEKDFISAVEEFLKDEYAVSQRWEDKIFGTINDFTQWESPILCHLLQIKMAFVTTGPVGSHYPLSCRVYLIVSQRFYERQMLADAVRCFSMATLCRSDMQDPLLIQPDLDRKFRLISGSLSSNANRNQSYSEVKEQEVDALILRISYIRFLEFAISQSQPSSERNFFVDLANKLVPETQKLLLSVFSMLSDPCLRGDCFESCHNFEASASIDASLPIEDTSTREPPEWEVPPPIYEDEGTTDKMKHMMKEWKESEPGHQLIDLPLYSDIH